jgi:hypothetical protein
MGFTVVLTAVIGSQYRPLVNVESELPDAVVPQPAAALAGD